MIAATVIFALLELLMICVNRSAVKFFAPYKLPISLGGDTHGKNGRSTNQSAQLPAVNQ